VTSSESLLTIDHLSNDGPRAVLRLAGEIDPHTVDTLTAALAPTVADPAVDEVVLDLAGVSFIDSSGLRAIISADVDLAARDARLVLRAPSESTRRLLEITDLLDRLTVE
jgi:anti-anti-sigma factor